MKINYKNPDIFPFPWASAWGKDQSGIWMEFHIKGVVQRMRWIFPGKFRMGSPYDEPERFKNEKQHPVNLTNGFWLADTACTQALWKAVMGENPSGFKGDDRPVETVSWDDCQEFLKKINNRIPGLNLQLPTEAQWEYACRAGTEGPFSFGNTMTPDQVNYHGAYPYQDGRKGNSQGGTVPVKSLPCNPWGLYEMHGNAFEWCRDRYGEYSSKPLTDPEGAKEGLHRVVRGGSWNFNVWRCRSAYRRGNEPGNRNYVIGFRFSRGHLE